MTSEQGALIRGVRSVDIIHLSTIRNADTLLKSTRHGFCLQLQTSIVDQHQMADF